MKITRELVLRIAKLAHLKLEEQEIETFGRQLQEILQYVETLNETTLPAEPFTYEHLSATQRPDEQQTSLSNEDALSNAPDRSGPFFRVPRIIP